MYQLPFLTVDWPVEDSEDQDGAGESQLQGPPIADPIGDAWHHHQSNSVERVGEDGEEGPSRGTGPLRPFQTLAMILQWFVTANVLYIP